MQAASVWRSDVLDTPQHVLALLLLYDIVDPQVVTLGYHVGETLG